MISVVVPTLNEEKYIKRCLESLQKRNQTYKDYEIILSDGCSEDNTVKIARPLCDKIVKSKKRTCAMQRQAGIDAAKGDIIALIDADCIADKDWIKNVADAFDKNKDIVAIQGRILLYDATMMEQMGAKVLDFLTSILAPMGIFAIGQNLSFKRDVFYKCGGFDTDKQTMDDIDFVKRVRKCGKLKYWPHALMWTSTRRMRQWGYAKFFTYQITNVIDYHLQNKAHTGYDDIR